LIFLQESSKSIETLGPESQVAIEPIIGFAHRFRPQAAAHDAAALFAPEESGIGQHAEMFHHRRQRH
jgi:hypothetical protein